MKKKTLVILLIIPFLIGLLSFVSIIVLNITVASDITGIKWKYNETEGFKIREEPYLLEAEPIIDSNLILASGNDLIWYEDTDEEAGTGLIDIKKENDKFYLYAKKEGSTKIICSNEKKTVRNEFDAVIYDNGAVIINPTRKASSNKIDKTKYYGEFDYKYEGEADKTKTPSKINAKFRVIPSVLGAGNVSQAVELVYEETSQNISYDATKNEVTIKSALKDKEGNLLDSYFTLRSVEKPYLKGKYTIKVIDGAVNVYNYDDLLYATNYSEKGEKVVLQVNLGSLKDVYEGEVTVLPNVKGLNLEQAKENGFITYVPTEKKKDNNTELFGHYDFKNNSFSFENEVYSYETSYNHEYLDLLNKNPDTKDKYSTSVATGIHVQKDFYGNGYSINTNELAFPRYATVDQNLKRLKPTRSNGATKGDVFLGPLAFVSIGDPENESLVKAYGEDNSALYIDGNNITLNDLRIQNIDENINRANLNFVGTCINIKGTNNTLKNSVMSNAKNIVRAFDTDGLLINNSILRRSAEFNLMVGSNSYSKYNENQNININEGSVKVNDTFTNYFNTATNDSNTNAVADTYYTKLLNGDSTINENDLYNTLNKSQEYLDNTSKYINSDGSINYAAKINVKDTLFGDSGIFSIALESLFNGCFLYNAYPSMVSGLLSSLFNGSNPDKIGGTSAPVELTLSGTTKFYDYKKIDEIDVNCLVEQIISSFLTQLGKDTVITVDDIFPMKTILKEMAKELGYIYSKDNEEYLNTEIAWYGGGKNLSTVKYDLTTDLNTYSDSMSVDVLKYNLKHMASSDKITSMLKECVLFAIGFNPFKFVTNDKSEASSPKLFDKSPEINELIKNA